MCLLRSAPLTAATDHAVISTKQTSDQTKSCPATVCLTKQSDKSLRLLLDTSTQAPALASGCCWLWNSLFATSGSETGATDCRAWKNNLMHLIATTLQRPLPLNTAQDSIHACHANGTASSTHHMCKMHISILGQQRAHNVRARCMHAWLYGNKQLWLT